MSTASALKARRKAELLAAILACENLLKHEFSRAYRQAFMQLARAGKRYDALTDFASDVDATRFEDQTYASAEPDAVEEALHDALSFAVDDLAYLRRELRGG